jgi:hypothetical protein
MRKSARRTVASLVAVVSLSALAFGVSPGMADSPHFLKATASLDSSGNLICAFKEAGLGTTASTANVSCSASASATYACINGGGNHPQAANKQTGTAAASFGFSESPVNGRVHAVADVAGTPPGTDGFTCPSGQALVLADVSYAVTLTDTTNNASISLAASQVFFTFAK